MDIHSLFKNNIIKQSPYFTGGGFVTKLAWRRTAFRAFRAKEISFIELVANLVPGVVKSDEMMNKVHRYADRELEPFYKEFMARAGGRPSFLLFDRPFFPHDSSLAHWIMAIRLIKEIVIDDQYQVNKFIREDSAVIDGGANIGAFTVFAAHKAPNGKVYSFEPARTTFETLSFNVGQYQNIMPVQKALGDSSRQGELALHATLSVGNTLLDSGRANQVEGEHVEREGVDIVSLDDFAKKENLKKVDFIKLDVEGYEKQAIEGAKELISAYRPTIAVSAYHLKGDAKAIPALMKSIYPKYSVELRSGSELDLFFWVE